VRAKLELSFYDLNEGSKWSYSETRDVELPPNQSTDLVVGMKCQGPPQGGSLDDGKNGPPIWTSSYSVVVSARLLSENGEVLARFSDWPQPFRHVEIPDPQLRITEDGEEIKVEVTKPVKGLWLSVPDEGEEVSWSDNALDVVPEDNQVVVARGLKGRSVWAAWLGKENSVPCAILRPM
jgi:beta-mannosidase